MSHQVENMFFVGATPWHGLGVQLDNPPTVADGIKQAGLDWQVGLRECFADVLGQGFMQEVPARAVVRETDGSILGVVGERYRPLQNVDAFGWFQPLLNSGECSLHTAGSLCEGRRVWILAKLNREAAEIAPGDTIEKFLLLSNSHDGTLAIRVGFVPIRVVCANTLRLAHDSKESSLCRILHTQSARGTLDLLRETVNLADAAFEATAEQYRRLAATKINQTDLRRYVKTVLELDLDDDRKIPTRSKNIVAEIIATANGGTGNSRPETRGTLWTAYNGVTEYLGTSRGRNNDSRLNSLWFGDSANVSQRALDLAIQFALAA